MEMKYMRVPEDEARQPSLEEKKTRSEKKIGRSTRIRLDTKINVIQRSRNHKTNGNSGV